MGDEYYLHHPSNQTFFRILVVITAIFCLNTQYWDWYKMPTNKLFRLQRVLVPIFTPVCTGSQIVFLMLNFKSLDFSKRAIILTMIPVAMAVTLKVATAQMERYKHAIIIFMKEIHLHNLYLKHYPDNVHKYIEMMCIKAEKNTRLLLAMVGSAFIICYCSWMVVPIIHNIQNFCTSTNITARFELTVYLWTPYMDYEHNIYAYIWVQILGVYVAAIAVIIILAFDTINLAIIIHLTGHIKIFKYILIQDQHKMLSDDEWFETLKKYSKAYGFIKKSFKIVESAFGLNVATIYAQNLFQGGLLLYQLITYGQDTEVILTYGLMIPIFMGMLIIISVVLENVRIQAEDIPMLVYALPWETMSVSNQKIFCSMLFQVQPTLEFVAAFNIKTGIQPAVNIIKTVFSYYVMIKSTKEKVTSF